MPALASQELLGVSVPEISSAILALAFPARFTKPVVAHLALRHRLAGPRSLSAPVNMTAAPTAYQQLAITAAEPSAHRIVAAILALLAELLRVRFL